MSSKSHLTDLSARIKSLIRAIQDNDEATIEAAIRRLSQSRRWLAPLVFAIGAFLLLFDGLRVTLSNWRLTLVQILPAMWIWLAMYDLKLHALHGRTFNVLRGPVLIPIGIVHHLADRRELSPERDVRVRDRRRAAASNPSGLRAGARKSVEDHRARNRRRRGAGVFDRDRHPLGARRGSRSRSESWLA